MSQTITLEQTIVSIIKHETSMNETVDIGDLVLQTHVLPHILQDAIDSLVQQELIEVSHHLFAPHTYWIKKKEK